MAVSELILFFSVDVVGSTAYKHSKRDPKASPQPWLQFFRDFFQDFPQQLQESVEDQAKDLAQPEIWKTAGDEIIFRVPLKCHVDALKYLMAFKNSIQEYTVQLRNKRLPLRLKGAVWVAGFPVINAVIHPNGKELDYIGPLVDAGFRLSKHADERKFVISVEVALLVTTAMEIPSTSKPVFFYEGREVLKGVLSDKPYPLIWVDMNDGQSSVEETLRGYARVPALPELLRDFCKEYIESSQPDLVIPYMEACDRFNAKPPHHQEFLDKADPQGLIEDSERDEPPGGAGQLTLREPIKKSAELRAAILGSGSK